MAGKRLGQVFVELQLDDKLYRQKLSEIQPNAVASAKGVETAWRALGAKSGEYFDQQRRAAENAFGLIKNSAMSSANDIVRAEEAKVAKIARLNEQQFGAHKSMADGIKTSWAGVGVAIAAVYSAFAAGKAVIDAALKMEQVSFAMKAVSGSSQLAAQELKYIREESERLGLVFSDTALSFAKFSAATRNTVIEGQETKKVFSAVAEAATALKLPAEEVNGIFMALQQMMSKGKVQAEELRGQLGERLPGAFQMAADAMGVSTAQLNEMLEKGEVLGSVLLPLLAEKLHETYGRAAAESAQGGQAAINRFNNALFETKAALGDGLMPVFTDVLNFLKPLGEGIKAFITGIKLATVELAVAIGDVIDAAKTAGKWASYAIPGMGGVGAFGGGKNDPTFAQRQTGRRQAAAASMAEIYAKAYGAPAQPGTVLGYEGGVYTYTEPEKKKKKGGAGGDAYENTLRAIANETKSWKDRIAELNPELDKEDSAIQKLTHDADKLIKKLEDQGTSRKKRKGIDVTAQVAQVRAELEQGIAFLKEKEEKKLQDEIEKTIDALKDEAAILGMTKDEIALYKLELKGANEEQLQLAASLQADVQQYKDLKDVLTAIYGPYEAFQEKIAKANSLLLTGQLDLETYTQYMGKLSEEMEKLSDKGKDQFKELKDAIEGWGKDSAQAIVDFALTGKASFSDMANSIIADMMKMMIQQSITGPLFKSISESGLISGLFGGLMNGGSTAAGAGSFSSSFSSSFSGYGAMLYHSGGVVGTDGVPIFAPASLFSGAKRYHSGLASDEFPAILQKGETVIPKGGSGGVNINVTVENSHRNAAVDVQQSKAADGSPSLRFIVSEMMAGEVASGRGAFNKAMQNVYGVKPVMRRA